MKLTEDLHEYEALRGGMIWKKQGEEEKEEEKKKRRRGRRSMRRRKRRMRRRKKGNNTMLRLASNSCFSCCSLPTAEMYYQVGHNH